MIKDVIRLKWQADLSHEQIALSLNISKGAVTKYLSLAYATPIPTQNALAVTVLV
jgi:predicted DNA-binding protein (UPF0251 family)